MALRGPIVCLFVCLFVCKTATLSYTPLPPQSRWEHIQVVYSNKVARKRFRPVGTPAMDLESYVYTQGQQKATHQNTQKETRNTYAQNTQKFMIAEYASGWKNWRIEKTGESGTKSVIRKPEYCQGTTKIEIPTSAGGTHKSKPYQWCECWIEGEKNLILSLKIKGILHPQICSYVGLNCFLLQFYGACLANESVWRQVSVPCEWERLETGSVPCKWERLETGF